MWMVQRFILVVISAICIQGNVVKRNKGDDEVCYDKLGCFSNGGPFWDRAIAFTPESPEVIGTKFYLFTRTNRNKAHILVTDDKNTLSSVYDPKKETKIIVHGFINSAETPWKEEMTNALLDYGDFNVIVVDWRVGALPLYSQASANTRVVGAQIARLITNLESATGVKPETFHIIGHSLGAHIGGYAGERINRLGRITGMDPAGPYFEGREIVVRLDPTDALFVDAIHTDGKSLLNTVNLNGGYGIKMPVGHVDFYPNGGQNQPSCKNNIIGEVIDKGLVDGVQHIACDHRSAYFYFIDSIKNRTPFTGYACNSYEKFEDGGCFENVETSEMGFFAKPLSKVNTKLYLDTASKKPFAKYHYKISVSLGSMSRSERGKMFVRVFGTKDRIDAKKITDDIEMESGKTYTLLFTSRLDIGEVTRIQYYWEHNSSWLRPDQWNLWRDPVIVVNNVQVFTANKTRNLFCSAQKMANNKFYDKNVSKRSTCTGNANVVG
ncbi:unnamed protein product [Owenia fusiformis]|uniref:Uncharacterized protein n=1 Tax=Owenia fusiformis TaxID=6347 RepID=A0A8J1UU37_OWEFU|nr:unnamed protein product [Owenia fusiformis]